MGCAPALPLASCSICRGLWNPWRFFGALLQLTSPLLIITLFSHGQFPSAFAVLMPPEVSPNTRSFLFHAAASLFPSCSSLGAGCRGLHSQQPHPRRGSVPHLSCGIIPIHPVCRSPRLRFSSAGILFIISITLSVLNHEIQAAASVYSVAFMQT